MTQITHTGCPELDCNMPCPRAFRSPGIVSPNLERTGDSGSTSELDAATLKVCAEDPDIDPVFRKSGYLISHKKN